MPYLFIVTVGLLCAGIEWIKHFYRFSVVFYSVPRGIPQNTIYNLCF